MKAKLVMALVRTRSAMLVGAVASLSSAAPAAMLDSATLQVNDGRTTLTVESGRPLAKAVETLVDKYGYAITYEDPRYAHEDDLQDVTAQVRKDLAYYPPGKAPKVIVPMGGKLELSFSSTDTMTILHELVQVQSLSPRGGQFRVERTEEFFHVVPTQIRDKNGNWTAQASVLDVLISFPEENRTERDTIRAICQAVSEATRIKVFVGGRYALDTGIFEEGVEPKLPYRIGADNETARDVLLRALAAIRSKTAERLTWRLLYGSNDNAYVLNVLPVPDKSSPAPKQAAPTTSTAPSSTRHRSAVEMPQN